MAAAIIAVLANGPVHIGSDSQTFVDKANYLLLCLRMRKPHNIVWRTSSDGDLWDHFEKAIIAKGPKSIRITKVKGYVTQKQVDAQKYRLCDKVGNDKADQAADIAVSMHGKPAIQLAKLWHDRHRYYAIFMQKVAKHIIEGYLIHRRLEDIRESNAPKGDSLIYYSPISISRVGDPISFTIGSNISYYEAFNRKHKSARDVGDFIASLRLYPNCHVHHAATWLEYI